MSSLGTGTTELSIAMRPAIKAYPNFCRSEEHTSELQSQSNLVCRLLLEKKKHNSNFYYDKLVLTCVIPASSAPVLQTPKATSSTLYFDSLTVNAGNGGFLHCIQMNTSVNAANQVVSVGADIPFFFF